MPLLLSAREKASHLPGQMEVGTLESILNYVKVLSLGQFPSVGNWLSAAWNGEVHCPQAQGTLLN